MNESKSPVLNAIEKIFGHDRIFNDKIDFIPDNVTMNKLFDSLNKILFNNRLPKIEVLCLSGSQIQQIFDRHQHNKDPNSFYALYFPIIDWNKITFVKKNQLPKIHYLIINTDNAPYSFSFILSQLCHEMIHYLDTVKGDVLFKFKTGFKNNIIENEHVTQIFMDKTNDINKTGISIFPDDGGFTSDELNKLCINRIKKLEEDIDSDNIDFSNFTPVAMKEANVDENGNIIAISF